MRKRTIAACLLATGGALYGLALAARRAYYRDQQFDHVTSIFKSAEERTIDLVSKALDSDRLPTLSPNDQLVTAVELMESGVIAVMASVSAKDVRTLHLEIDGVDKAVQLRLIEHFKQGWPGTTSDTSMKDFRLSLDIPVVAVDRANRFRLLREKTRGPLQPATD